MQERVEAIMSVTGASQFNSAFKGASDSISGFKDTASRLGSVGNKFKSVGGNLTSSITKPVGIATTAVGGLIGALGFKRLIGLDSAKAKLKGLGYETKDVERIALQVTDAVAGGMTTLGEGVDIAAGALAAGIDEGGDLERYIRLVGDAAVGANRPVGEMAQIFNRVQGKGKIMTEELNRIEDGMPGFSIAMAKHIGVAPEELLKMVTAGEVSSKDFLAVMEDFAGGMSGAISESFAGMAKNVLAYVGMIGEALINGLFIDGKKGLADFIEVLKSPEIMTWATKTGEQIRVATEKIVTGLKSVVDWWANLNEGTKDVIIQFGLFMVAIGPILSVIGNVMGATGILISVFAKLKLAVTALGVVFGVASGVIVAVIAGVVALVAVFVYFYKTNETVRKAVKKVWSYIKGLIMDVVSIVVAYVKTIWGTLVSFWKENNELILSTVDIVWNKIKSIIQWVIDYIVPLVVGAWEVIKENTATVWEAIKGTIDVAINLVLGIIKTVMQIIQGDWAGAWETINSVLSTAWEGIREVIKTSTESIKQTIQTKLKEVWGVVKTYFGNIANSIKSKLSEAKNSVVNKFNEIKSTITSKVTEAYNVVKTYFTNIANSVRNKLSDAKNNVVNKFNEIKNTISSKVSEAYNVVRSKFQEIANIIRTKITEAKNNVVNKFNEIRRAIANKVSEAVTTVRIKFNEIVNAIREKMNDAVDKVKEIGGGFKSFFDNIDLYASGRKIIQSAINGIMSLKSTIGDKVSGVAQSVRDFWPFSPAKEGPLKDIDKMDFSGPIGDSIKKAKNPLRKSMEGLAKATRDGFDVNGINSKISQANSKIQSDLSYNLSEGESKKEPAQVSLNLGRREYKGFVADISNQQGEEIDLELSF